MAHSSRCTAHNSLAVLALKAGMPLQPGGAVCEQHCGPIDMHFYSPADSEQYITTLHGLQWTLLSFPELS